MKLDIGCGEKPREGYTGVDVRRCRGVRIVCAAWEVGGHVAPGTVEAIYCRHMLEHLTRDEGLRALRCWYGVLRLGGSVELLVPDLLYHARQLVEHPDRPSAWNPRVSNRAHALGSIYGWQRFPEDLHKTGYAESELLRLLESVGFSDVRRVMDEPWHLHIEGVKR